VYRDKIQDITSCRRILTTLWPCFRKQGTEDHRIVAKTRQKSRLRGNDMDY